VASDNDQLRERVILLEENAAHQSIVIDELSSQLAEQWKIIDHLQLKMHQVLEQFQAMEDAGLEAPANTKPPHY
jgi:SlyX protein